jgi:hypothetical protein
MKALLYWLPRSLAILLIAFISVFALDVIGEPRWFIAMLIHLIPSYILSAVTAVAWKNEMAGGVLFSVFGIFILFFTRFEAVIIAVPALVIGVLFLVGRHLVKT